MSYKSAFLRRAAKLLIVLTVVGALAVPALASQKKVTFSLTPGASTAPITMPAYNTPISLMGAQTALGYRAVGQVTALCVKPFSFIEWVGFDFFSGAIVRNFSSISGTHIIWIDFSGQVDIQVFDANHIIVHNASAGVRTGVLTFTW